MLFPRESESREIKDLSGIWNFKRDADDRGMQEHWFSAPPKYSITRLTQPSGAGTIPLVAQSVFSIYPSTA